MTLMYLRTLNACMKSILCYFPNCVQLGTVTIGINNQPICVPGNSTITIPGKLLKLVSRGTYMIELAVHNSLPSGAVVNHSYVTP